MERSDPPHDGFRLRLMGGFAFEHPEFGSVSLPNRKACGLLSYLALCRDGAETRERLAGLFWSERPEDQARTSLRQCLKHLHTTLLEAGFQGLWRDRLRIGIDRNAISTDLQEYVDALDRGTLPRGVLTSETAPQRILYGFDALDPSFGAWLNVARQTWHDNLVDRLQAILSDRSVDTTQVYEAASALVQIDPTHEEAQRSLMRHHAVNGNVGAALKQYRQLWDLLGEEYDMEPAQETQDLVAAIKLGEYRVAEEHRPPPSPAPAVTANLPVIRVRPFVQAGPEERNRYLIAGFRRDLVATLVRFREWIVTESDRDDPSGGDGSGPTPPQMRYELDGAYVDDGTTLRLIITLKNAVTHRYIWSEQLTVSLARWFEAQHEIVRRLALSLNHYLSADRLARYARLSTAPQEIYDRWLKGRDLTLVWSHENEVQAEEIFRGITRDAPEFSRAFSSLTTIYNTRHLRNPGVFRLPELEAEALRLAQVSVNLDPLDTRNQMALAWSYLMHRRFDQAELHFELTYELNPSNPATLVPCAHGLNYCGHHERALEMAETAIRLNSMLPKFHWGYIMCIRFFVGDFRGCLAAGDQAEDVITDLYGWRAAALGHLGREAEAAEAARRFVALVRSRWRGRLPPSERNVTDWFRHCFPIRRPEDMALLREGLCKAGLPAEQVADVQSPQCVSV